MERISNRQLILIGIAAVMDSTLISVPAQITTVAKADFWVSYLLAAACMTAPLWMLSKLSARFPNMDLYDIAVRRHPVLGRMVALIYVLFFFFILSRDIRSIVDFVNTALLPVTPLSVTAAFITVTVILIARGGIEVTARMNTLWQPALIIVACLVPLSLFREFEPRHLLPSFENGLLPSIQGGWYAVSYIGEIVVLPFIFADRSFRFRSGLTSLLLGVFLLELLHWSVILTLGIYIPGRTVYPNYELVRHIRLTDFLDRFDFPLVGIWLPAMIVKTSFCLFAVCHGIYRVLPAVSPKEISTPLGALAFACSFWFFRNNFNLFNFNGVWPAIALIFEWLIPLLLFALLRPKRGTTRA